MGLQIQRAYGRSLDLRMQVMTHAYSASRISLPSDIGVILGKQKFSRPQQMQSCSQIAPVKRFIPDDYRQYGGDGLDDLLDKLHLTRVNWPLVIFRYPLE